MESMHIRTAKSEDVSQLVALNMEVHDVHVEIEPLVFREISEEFLGRSILRSLNDENSTIIVAVDELTIIGYILLQRRVRPKFDLMHERKCVYIDQVCVLKKYRHQGVFKMLLTKAKELTREWGIKRLELDVWSNNVGAKSSFLKSGFVPYNEKMKIDL